MIGKIVMKKRNLFLLLLCFVTKLFGMTRGIDLFPDTVQVNKDNIVLRFKFTRSLSSLSVKPDTSRSSRKDKQVFVLLANDCFFPIAYSRDDNDLDFKKAYLHFENKGCIIKLIIPKNQN